MTQLGVEQGAVYVFTSPLGDRAVIGPAATDPDWIGYLDGPPTGLERATVRENADEIDEADGGRHDPFFFGRLAFTMSGLVYPDGGASTARVDKLLAATDCMTDDGLLQWTGELGVAAQLAFRSQQPTRITDRRPKKFLIAGVSEGAAVLSQTEHSSIIIPGALASGGFASPLSSPIVSAAFAGGSAIVTNAGRSKTYARLLITGPCSNPYVLNSRTGQALFFNYTLGAGEFLDVDMNPKARRILLNGQVARYSALDSGRSSWWPLLKGDNTIQIGYSAYSAGAQVELRYRDAWG